MYMSTYYAGYNKDCKWIKDIEVVYSSKYKYNAMQSVLSKCGYKK